jgi:hypothetical protein
VGKRIPWDEALAFWLALGPERGFGKVAKKFGVSDVAVGKHAKANGWLERARRVDEQAALEAEHRGVRLRADRIDDTIKIVEASRVRFAEQLSRGEGITASGLAALLRHEALFEGEATDRVERADLDRELQRWIEAARSHMSEEEFLAFLDELERLGDDDWDTPP